ncbi:MAG: hypothetical protein GXO93_04010 [FCB group bacterium]|nr:hypothetical protein [FCB group bacterium]
MKKNNFYLPLLLVLFLVFATGVNAKKACFDCHKTEKKEYLSKKVIHKPVKNDNCESCHKRHGFSQQLILKDNSSELCYSCHKNLKEKFASGNVHFPVAKGVCWDCHDPHASNKKFLLRTGPKGADDPSYCLVCHKDDIESSLKGKYPHQPFQDYQCLTCHSAHNSDYEALLKEKPKTLCNSCHKQSKEGFAKAHKGIHTEQLSCIDCHTGHSADTKGLLSDKTHPPFAEGDCTVCHSLPDTQGKITFEEGVTSGNLCGNCHQEQVDDTKKAYPHEAVEADNCDNCHNPHSSRYPNLLISSELDLCTNCHSDIVEKSDSTLHVPVALGECSKCHEVHGSDNKNLLVKTDSTLCLSCHTDFAAQLDSAQSVHAGIKDCLVCHAPHQGEGKYLLKKDADQLCIQCHKQDEKALSAVSGHQPYLTGKCVACHSPHFSNSEHLLREGGNKICLGCHADIATRVKMPYPHPAAEEDCLNCHTPHYSDKTNLLSAPVKELCANCHDYDELNLTASHVHTPAKEGDCVGCHNPHGATKKDLITGRMIKINVKGTIVSRYIDLTDKKSDLCFTCHESLVEKFRQPGVHAPVAQGKCDVCHANHGSDYKGFIKDEPSKLCGSCHTLDSTLFAKHDNYNLNGANCLDCHDPHISQNKYLLRANEHPPFEDGDCEDCHTLGENNKVELIGEEVEICGNCHDNIDEEMKKNDVHPPFEAGECTSCHSPHASNSQKLLKEEGSQLCFTCHDGIEELQKLPVEHPPFKEGKCLDCHEPHASNYTKLKKRPSKVFCLSCHEDIKKEISDAAVHPPVKNGKCTACHLPHAGKRPLLLKAEKSKLCSQCHDLTSSQMKQAHHGFSIVKANCQNCHSAHASPKGTKGLLNPVEHPPFADGDCSVCHEGTNTDKFAADNVKELCLACHEDFESKLTKADIHPPVMQKDGCVKCHSPHAGFGEGIQVKKEPQNCLTCHDNQEFTGKIKHPPAFEDCTNCHDPHSNDYKYLLDSPSIFDLCLSCHDDARETHYHPMGKGVTDPRTKQTLNCVSCHSPHSSNYTSLLFADKNRDLCITCHNVSHTK